MSKKDILKMGLLAGLVALSIGNASAATASSAEAKVEITGEITAATCQAGWDVTKNIQVDLGKVSADKMTTPGDIGAIKPFVLSLTGCSGVNTISVTAQGTPDATESSDFANTLKDGAAGVAVQVLGGPAQDTVITPDALTSVDYPVSGDTANLTFLAEMVRTAKADTSNGDTPTSGVTVGKLTSLATLYLTYE